MIPTDKEILDWLEENTAYIMIGADLSKGRGVMTTLENEGKGWDKGELRKAVARHLVAPCNP